jgi:hypothetical protein
MARFDGEPVGADRSQKYRMKIPSDVFVHDLDGMIQ